MYRSGSRTYFNASAPTRPSTSFWVVPPLVTLGRLRLMGTLVDASVTLYMSVHFMRYCVQSSGMSLGMGN